MWISYKKASLAELAKLSDSAKHSTSIYVTYLTMTSKLANV